MKIQYDVGHSVNDVYVPNFMFVDGKGDNE